MEKSLFSRQLLAWYSKNARDLPWRKTRDPYKIWVSEIMLQQTTVAAVIPYYLKWVKAFPTVQAVARAPLKKILRLWQGLGYYQRARNIHKSAKIISEVYKGKIPNDPMTLKTLPGFGPYTIGAVLSIAFNQRYPIIDANVRRVVMRQLGIRGYAEPVHDKRVLSYLERVMPQQGMSDFNQALMELGALVCRNRLPLCASCPVKNVCVAYKKGIQEIIPTPKETRIKNVSAAVAVIRKNGLYLIQKRPAKGLLAGLWEFPGGKVEPGETPLQALSREIAEELGVQLVGAKPLTETTHFYTSYRVRLHAYDCKLSSLPKASRERKWVSMKSIQAYPLPSGSAKILDYLLHNAK